MPHTEGDTPLDLPEGPGQALARLGRGGLQAGAMVAGAVAGGIGRQEGHNPAPQGASLGSGRDPGPTRPSIQGDLAGPSLQADSILIEEYRFAAATATQAAQGHDQTLNLYLLVMGGLLSGLGAVYQLTGEAHTITHPLGAALLAGIGLMTAALFVRLVRQMRAFRESLAAMDQIKEFYIAQCSEHFPGMRTAFRWHWDPESKSLRRVLPGITPSSVVMVTAGLCLAAATFISSRLWLVPVLPAPLATSSIAVSCIAAVLIGALVVALEVGYYRRATKVIAGATEPAIDVLRLEAEKLGRAVMDDAVRLGRTVVGGVAVTDALEHGVASHLPGHHSGGD